MVLCRIGLRVNAAQESQGLVIKNLRLSSLREGPCDSDVVSDVMCYTCENLCCSMVSIRGSGW